MEDRLRQVRARNRSEKQKKRRLRSLRGANFGLRFVTMLAVVAAVVLVMVIFFRIKHIDVVGNTYYTAGEIAAASGVELDDNLLTLNKAAAAARIRADLRYVSEVQIKRSLPNRIIITVSEFEVTYAIRDGAGQWWLINREGRVMEQADAQSAKEHMQVQGVTIQVPEPGGYIHPESPEGADQTEIEAKKDAVLTMLELLEQSPFAKSIVTLDVGTSYDICLWYGTQYQIKLGNTEQIEYKMQYLQGVLNSLEPYQSGVIDLTFTEDQRAHFQPFD